MPSNNTLIFTDEELQQLAEITDLDRLAAVEFWMANVPKGFEDLIFAAVENSGGNISRTTSSGRQVRVGQSNRLVSQTDGPKVEPSSSRATIQVNG